MDDDGVDLFIAALAQADEQLQWGWDLQEVEQATRRLRDLAPHHPRIALLERKLAGMRERMAARSQRSIRDVVNVYIPVFV